VKNPGIPVVLFTILTVVFFCWYCAPSTTNVKKAEQYNQESANANTQSQIAETEANSIDQQVNVVDADRQTAKKNTEAAKVSVRNAENNIKTRKAQYDSERQKVVVVDGANIDARERRLLTDLRKLYWQNK
jgi:flagellar biosynthesis component FlhA